jgi:SP family arabinose:H+ symporter-like MFS transporter
MNKQNKIKVLLITLVASLGGGLFGFDMAVISGVLPLVQKQFALSASQEGWFVSSALVGCIIGVAISGELSDRLGRKIPLILTALLFISSALGCAFMPGLSGVIAFRIVGGIGIGIASSVVPLYISEIAPAEIRGRLVTYYQFALTLGILLAYLSNALLLDMGPVKKGIFGAGEIFNHQIWRGMLGMGLIPAVFFLFGLFMIPESPRWLIQKGKLKEGAAIMGRISGKPMTQQEVLEFTSLATGKSSSYRDLFSPALRRALLIGILLPLFSQFSGINAIIYYGPRILGNAGISLSNSLVSQIIFGAANMVFTLLAIWKVDKWGRRPLYLYGTAGAAISLICTGLCFYLGATSSIWLLLCVLAFLGCFACSIGPLKFVVASEIFPGALRGRALAISIMVMWVADTLVGQITPVLLKEIGSAGTFWFFAFFCVVAFITVYKLLPETKGKSLEQIENEWDGAVKKEIFLH